MASHGLKAKSRVRDKIESEPVDVLFLHNIALSRKLNRKQDLIRTLTKEIPKVIEYPFMDRKAILKSKKFFGKSV